MQLLFLGASFFLAVSEKHTIAAHHSYVFVQPHGWGTSYCSRGWQCGWASLDLSSGPNLERTPSPWYHILLLSHLFLPRGDEHFSLSPEPVSPQTQEEWERGLMEANPYFGSFLFVGWGSRMHRAVPGVLSWNHGAAGRGRVAHSCLCCRRAPRGTAAQHSFTQQLWAWSARVLTVSSYLGCNPGPASKFRNGHVGALSTCPGARRRAQDLAYSMH